MDAHTNRPGQTAGPSHGSRTMTMHDVPSGEQAGQGGSGAGQEDRAEGSDGVLRLRGGGNTRRVVWSEETVDNEGMGKKKSKICCIYHKPKAFDESSDESSSGSSDVSSASNSSLDSDAEPSDTSTSRRGSLDSGVNASTSLREARERKKRSDGCEGPAGHECRRRSKKRQGAGRTGGRTTVQTQQEQVDNNVPPTKPAPNAYERGIA